MKKVAVVTGGTRGIGKAIAVKLLAEGYAVAAIYHGNKQAAKDFEAETDMKSWQCDICDFESCQKTIEAIEKKLGPVSVLINNAGITKDSMLHKMSMEDWDSVLYTNLFSCFNMCRAVMGGMRDRGAGRIVNISSINGQKGQLGQTNYAAAKAGMLGFTKALALESAAKGVTVNAICPGYITTDMTAAMPPDVLNNIVRNIPVGRMGEVEEIASAVAYLVSDQAAFITGATLTINGGQYMAA